jgi:molybdate transport system substrate-binding protein
LGSAINARDGETKMLGLIGRCLAVALVLLLPAPAGAQGEVRVFVAGAMTDLVMAAGESYSRRTGQTVAYVSDTAGALQKRLASGERADMIVATATALEALQKDNRLQAGTRVDLARALIGVGVRPGATVPDLSSPDSFKAALLKARSVSYVNPASGGTSGTYFEGLLQKMGIFEAMKPKIVYRTQGALVAAAVASGDAEMGITFTSELRPNAGVRVAGTLPAAIQLPTVYAGALVSGATNPAGARAFLATLAGTEGRALIEKAGLEGLAAR